MDLVVNGLTDGEVSVLEEIKRRVDARTQVNQKMQAWYDAKARVRNLGLSLPGRLSHIYAVSGWPGMVVDALEERLDIDGFDGEGAGTVSEIWRDNALDTQYSDAHIEALVHGVCFVVTDHGGPGDPEPVVTVESPTTTSGIYDPIRRRLSSAATFIRGDDPDKIVAAVLYLRDETIQMQSSNNVLEVVNRNMHGLDRVMVERLVNRPRTSKPWGRSEITRPIVSYTEQAIRTLLRGEITSEFFSAPQRWILGVGEDAFQSGNGSSKSAIEAYLGHMLAISDADDPDIKRPELGQFDASSPAPFIEMIKMYAQLVAGEAALPPTYMGFVTENPASADQIRATEARHVKRAERRQRTFGRAWRESMISALALREGSFDPAVARGLRVRWKDASTPTRAATADAVVKQVQAGVLPVTSEVTLQQLGYDEATVKRLVNEQKVQQARQMRMAMYSSDRTVQRSPRGDRGDFGDL